MTPLPRQRLLQLQARPMEVEDELYYLQEGEVEVESTDGYQYEQVQDNGGGEQLSSDDDEDLETALQHTLLSSSPPQTLPHPLTVGQKLVGVSASGEVVEDFVRNFLVRSGLRHTAECFQSEWYQLAATGQLQNHHRETVADVYNQNRILEEEVTELRRNVEAFKQEAQSAKEQYVRLKKERDYHRMHHRRTLQEKERLLAVVKSLRDQLASYQPTMRELKGKYETATREKMLATLEKNKALAEVGCLQSTLHSLRPSTLPHTPSAPLSSQPKEGYTVSRAPPHQHPQAASKSKPHTGGVVVSLPPEPANPYRHSKDLPVCAQLTRVGGLQCVRRVDAHSYPISCVALHPTKNVLATASDDHSWKLWTTPSGEQLMTGEGHSDWLSCCQFHPRGDMLATTAGDGTAKLWSFTGGGCVLTLADHCQPVWSCSWHWSGELLATAAMDHCCKLWDVQSGQCVVTLRGHADSVNAVQWLPYTNTLATCSADKTVSLWDARMGLCVQTFYGHHNSCNAVISNPQSTLLYSADCFGSVVCWEVRTASSHCSWDLGPLPVNTLAIDPADSVLACASGSGAVQMIDKSSGRASRLEGGSGSVEALVYSHSADMLYTGSTDGALATWQ